MKKFEYKSYNTTLYDNELNKLGAKGWELVSHTAIADRGKMAQYYVFKKEII
jgi:hypothetical protein